MTGVAEREGYIRISVKVRTHGKYRKTKKGFLSEGSRSGGGEYLNQSFQYVRKTCRLVGKGETHHYARLHTQ